jgi:hypothetical protein
MGSSRASSKLERIAAGRGRERNGKSVSFVPLELAAVTWREGYERVCLSVGCSVVNVMHEFIALMIDVEVELFNFWS